MSESMVESPCEIILRAICCGDAACFNEDSGVACAALSIEDQSHRLVVQTESILTALASKGYVIVEDARYKELLETESAHEDALSAAEDRRWD